MIINHNMSAMYSNRVLGMSNSEVQKNLEKLSSGYRINRAGDDAAGLAVSEKLRSQVRGLNMASTNAANGINFIQTTEGYLQGITDIVQRIRELSVQAANGIYTDEDRQQIQVEVNQLVDEVDRIANSAQYNGMNLLTGRFAEAGADGAEGVQDLYFHVGANMDQRLKVNIGNMTANALGIGILSTTHEDSNPDPMIDSLSSTDGANRAIGVIDVALASVNKQRADLGAYQNRLENTVRSIDNAAENLQASESRIRDTDMAKMMVDYTKNQILVQSGTAMLAQANQQTQNVLALLR